MACAAIRAFANENDMIFLLKERHPSLQSSAFCLTASENYKQPCYAFNGFISAEAQKHGLVELKKRPVNAHSF
jgi:hypothetical protein